MGKLDKKAEQRLQELRNLQRSGWVLDPDQKAELAELERESKKPPAREK